MQYSSFFLWIEVRSKICGIFINVYLNLRNCLKITGRDDFFQGKFPNIQVAQNSCHYEKKVDKRKKLFQKLSTMKGAKNRKNKVIHKVIHIIHIKTGKKCGLHSKKIECPFCKKIIKLIKKRKSEKKTLTF